MSLQTDPRDFKAFDKAFLKSAGGKIFGTDIKIVNPDKDGNGEICYKGRNRFMGSFLNLIYNHYFKSLNSIYNHYFKFVNYSKI